MTIKGKNFGASQATSIVSFNVVAAAVTRWSDNAIICTVPVGAPTGPVTVTTSVGTSKGKKFTIKI